MEEILIQLDEITRPAGEDGLFLGIMLEGERLSELMNPKKKDVPEPLFMGHLKSAKVLGMYQDFRAESLPDGIPSKARRLTNEILSTELTVWVKNKAEFSRVLKRLSLRVDMAGKDVCYGMDEEQRAMIKWVTDRS